MTTKDNSTKKVLGIVAEYNPMHKGHMYQIEECKKQSGADAVVAIMSGNFTQRGHAALLDKWKRAEMAINGGVDLVIELPFASACNSAEYFAKGAVEILQGMGVVTHLGFGSECGDIDKIKTVASLLLEESPEFQEKLKGYLDKGESYPKARMLALGEDGEILNEPNNILAVEYAKAIAGCGSGIEAITVKRKGSGYHQEEVVEEIASGSGIRKILENGGDVTGVVSEKNGELLKENLENMVFEGTDKYFELVKAAVLVKGPGELEEIFSVGEGIENRILKEIRMASSMEDLIGRVKSKRYTYTALSRIFAHILLGFKKDHKQDGYIRVLGFNEKGARLLKEMKKKELNSLPVVTNINKHQDVDFGLDVRATDIYNLLSGGHPYENSDFVKQPVRIMGDNNK